jgi:regulator of PEP synthase PpsR (kinase-PPPase family)
MALKTAVGVWSRILAPNLTVWSDASGIMSTAGHVSRAMLSRYSHVRMEAKRRALDEIAARQRAADKERKDDAERREQDAVASQLVAVVQ